jgi:hypothetical protein
MELASLGLVLEKTDTGKVNGKALGIMSPHHTGPSFLDIPINLSLPQDFHHRGYGKVTKIGHGNEKQNAAEMRKTKYVKTTAGLPTGLSTT